MTYKYAVVVTTINYPTFAVKEIAKHAPLLDAQFVIIGDQKSPPDFSQDGCVYFDLEAQHKTAFDYARNAPARHYARKNIGYLIAIANDANVIIETDDDNIPKEGFWSARNPRVNARVLESKEWINVYGYFCDTQIWPRGLPLNCVTSPLPSLSNKLTHDVFCPIQQGLADENPDVDAIYRLILPLPVNFQKGEPIALKDAWCPFNSQNTTWFAEAFPLLYLPYNCSFRMTDIWRSFVAQRIAYLNGWSVLFHSATVYQERNEHDLMRDFAEEIPGYLHNQQIRNALDSLSLKPGVQEIPDAMRTCYEKLIELGYVGSEELTLLNYWLSDLSGIADC